MKVTTYQWLINHTDHQGEGCLEWPFSCNWDGYGRTGKNGVTYNAHRVMCELAHGKPPSAIHQAAHSCHNTSCVNPNHLRWATPSENQRERYAAGRGLRNKLTPGKRKFILQLLDEGVSQKALAKQFNVSPRLIRFIRDDAVKKDLAA